MKKPVFQVLCLIFIYQETFLLSICTFALVYQQIVSLSQFCLEQVDKTLVATNLQITLCQNVFQPS